MLTVEGLTCRYGKVAAVRELSIRVNEGELVSLIGANGAGKTTTLKAISGVLAPIAGRIIASGAPAEIHRNPEVIKAYLGERYVRAHG